MGESIPRVAMQEQPESRDTLRLSVLVALLLALTLVLFYHISQKQSDSAIHLGITSDLRVLVKQIANYTLRAGHGDSKAFSDLENTRSEIDTLFAALKDGSETAKTPVSPPKTHDVLESIASSWKTLREKATFVIDARADIELIRSKIANINELTGTLQSAANEAVRALTLADDDPDHVFLASSQLLLIQQIQARANKLLEGGKQAAEAVDGIEVDSRSFRQALQTLSSTFNGQSEFTESERSILEILREISSDFEGFRTHIQELIPSLANALPAIQAVEEVTDASENTERVLDDLGKVYEKVPGRWSIGPLTVGTLMVTVLGIFTLLLFTLLGIKLIRQARKRQLLSEEANRRNRASIRLLVDELGDLADGDLTVEVTETNRLTSEIAKAINYAIVTLRRLVSAIDKTARQVSSAAENSRKTASLVADTSKVQSRQVESFNSAIIDITDSVKQMSKDSEESASVAKNSVDIAKDGVETVLSIIQSIGHLLGQISETDTLLSHLNYSSSQIERIGKLIEQIADQTSLLALNASVQAAVAGESGKGFTAVAEGIRRLAEDTRIETRKIENFVNTIQTDARNVIESMKKSSASVLSGVSKAEVAGDAIKDIENYSTRIATITDSIARKAHDQVSLAKDISSSMTDIVQVTEKTSKGTKTTADAMLDLTHLSHSLKEIVSEFHLPDMLGNGKALDL